MAVAMIGKDVRPEVGTRVEMDPRRGDRGVGTIVQLNGDGRSVAVNWDSGERDNEIPTGDGGQYYLIKTENDPSPPKAMPPALPVDVEPVKLSPRDEPTPYAEPRPSYETQPRPSYETEVRPSYETQPRYPDQFTRADEPAAPRPSANLASITPSQPYVVPASQAEWEPRNVVVPSIPSYQKTPSNTTQSPRRPPSNKEAPGDWLEEMSGLSGLGRTPTRTPSSRTMPSRSSTARAANVSRASTTVGMSVYGTKVDLVVPGGPAQLSQNLEKHDEILEVDGRPVTQETLTPAIIGSDSLNTTVQLKVRKARSGQVVAVELLRVPKKNIESMVELFEVLTKLKQNGHNNAEFERANYPPDEEPTVELVDRVVAMLSAIQLEKYHADLRTRKQFQDLYNELREHLADAYNDMDRMEKQQQQQQLLQIQASPSQLSPRGGSEDAEKYKQQAAQLTVELEDLKKQLEDARLLLEASRAQAETAKVERLPSRASPVTATRASAPPPPPPNDEELKAKEAELGREIEKGMQKDFEIRRLQAQSDLLVEELEAAQRALIGKEEELQRRSAEDADLERKVQILQGHLDEVEADEGQLEEVQARLQKEVKEKEKAVQALKEEHRKALDQASKSANANVEVTKQQLEQAKEVLKKKSDELEALRERLRQAAKESESLESALRDASRQLQEDKVEMRRLQERARQGAFRAGDVVEVTVQKATGLPQVLEHESDVREVSVVINIDGRHQVQQTSKQMGRDLIFNESFTAYLEPASRMLNASVYSNEPGKPGELLGQAQVDLEKVKWGAGEPVVLPLQDDEGKPVYEHGPSDRNARMSTLELVVGKGNIAPEQQRKAEEDQNEIRQLKEELEAARECIRGLERQVAEARQQVRGAQGEAESAEALRKDLRRLEADLGALQKRLSAREVQVQELESTVAIKDQLVQELQKSVVTVQKEKQLQVISMEETIQNLRNTLSTEQGARQEVREVKDERDLLMQRVKVLTEELVAAQDGLDELQKKAKNKEGQDSLAEHLEKENGVLKERLKEKDQEAKRAREELAKERINKPEPSPDSLAGQVTAKEYQAEMLKMQVQLDQVQVQYDDLLKQFQQTRRKDKQEAEAEANKLQGRIQALLQQLEGRHRSASPAEAPRRVAMTPPPPGDSPRRIIRREEVAVQRTSAPPVPLPAAGEIGVIGIKIENNPPHHVMSVSELMDEYGKLINNRVKVGHELVEIDNQPVKNLPVGDVIRRVSGPPGTTVTLRFLDEDNNRVYDIKALRHIPLRAVPGVSSGSAGPTRSPPLVTGSRSAGPQVIPARVSTLSGSAGPPPANMVNLNSGPGMPIVRLASSRGSPPPGTSGLASRTNPVSNRTSPATPPKAEFV